MTPDAAAAVPPILTSTEQVAELAGRLIEERIIALDLEADSLHHYQEKVCLLQVTASSGSALIDPLSVDSLEPLAPILAAPEIRKVFHDGGYDLRCLRRDFDLEVRGLFDTMICAQFAGEEQLGLAGLLAKHFAVTLDKRFQRADWSRRPLSEEMVRYAAEDTRHLIPLAALLDVRLRELGRLEWVLEEFTLVEHAHFAVNEGPICLRFKGAGRLERRQLGILEELLQWREQAAARRDCPPFKIIGNSTLLSLAQRAPSGPHELVSVEGLSLRHRQHLGRKLLAAIKRGQQLPEQQLPIFPRRERRQREPQFDRRLAALKGWRMGAAKRYGLDPGILINHAMLEEIARCGPGTQEELAGLTGIKRWQYRELGEQILACL